MMLRSSFVVVAFGGGGGCGTPPLVASFLAGGGGGGTFMGPFVSWSWGGSWPITPKVKMQYASWSVLTSATAFFHHPQNFFLSKLSIYWTSSALQATPQACSGLPECFNCQIWSRRGSPNRTLACSKTLSAALRVVSKKASIAEQSCAMSRMFFKGYGFQTHPLRLLPAAPARSFGIWQMLHCWRCQRYGHVNDAFRSQTTYFCKTCQTSDR